LDDDEVIDAEEGDAGFFAIVEDDVVLGFDFGDLVVGLVSVALGVEVFGDGDPGADVVPVEGGLDVEDAGGFFHEGVVDGDGGEFREFLGDGGGDVRGVFEFVDEAGELWGVLLKFGGDGLERPDKHAGVPSEVALAEELLGEFGIWFFAEAGDFEGLVGGLEVELCGLAALDISVGWTGPSGLDSDGDEGICLGGDAEAISEDGLERVAVLNELIRGEHSHGGIWVTSGDEADAEGNSGGGVALCGLGEDVSGRKHVGDFADFFFLKGVGEDEDVLAWDEALETGDGLVERVPLPPARIRA